LRSQLANLLTGARLGLAIVILAVAGHPVVAWWLFVVALASDYLDGLVARRLGIMTATGQLLDPFADAVLAISALIYLVSTGWLAIWAAIPFVLASGASYYAYSSRLWDLLWVRLGASLASLAVYGLMVVGFACRAYGWHAYYLAIMAVIAVPVAWVYRDRIRSDVSK
jgi:phosphatidylglycerophosphate synthase